ncbi:guanylate kinase [Cephaloticoccus primus]|uniref:Guanylate kinase n=1 Tax=Cephaloticoccus primus TaxID=1548207 RepID=A0A139SU60_9BACT|nr:guanylate kinase [Cephaloticoccus primus]
MTAQNRNPLFVVIAGPTASGKSTLCERLVKEPQLGFERVITTTTRAPRPGEIDGVHYHFLSPEVFEEKVRAGEFLEWAWVHGDRRYGTLASSVIEPLSRGQNLVANVDVQGVASLRACCPRFPLLARSLVPVFINITPEELQQRIRARGTDDEAEIARRMATAEKERAAASQFEHQIHSGSRDEDFAALLEIIEQAKSHRG